MMMISIYVSIEPTSGKSFCVCKCCKTIDECQSLPLSVFSNSSLFVETCSLCTAELCISNFKNCDVKGASVLQYCEERVFTVNFVFLVTTLLLVSAILFQVCLIRVCGVTQILSFWEYDISNLRIKSENAVLISGTSTEKDSRNHVLTTVKLSELVKSTSSNNVTESETDY